VRAASLRTHKIIAGLFQALNDTGSSIPAQGAT
jgi:hypothetical protein